MINPEFLEALRSLSACRVLLVTGPQRSGTTIGARILSQETGLTYVDENDYAVHNCHYFETLLREQAGIVVHCPAMSRWIHTYSRPGQLVVFMMRDLAEIKASADRVNWNSKPEITKYKTAKINGATLHVCQENIAEVTYMYWESVQRPYCKHWLELHYDSLSGHPLFVPKHKRENFTARQWRADA